MYTLHLLGKPFLTKDGQKLSCSQKSLALLSILALEEQGQSRDRLASLLWNHAAGRQNLRVELTKLRALGLHLSDHASALSIDPLLEFTTDLGGLFTATLEQESELLELLKRVRGLPLEGLIGIGSPAFSTWSERLCKSLLARLNALLLGWNQHCADHHWSQGSEALLSTASLLGIELQTRAQERLPVSARAKVLHFVRPTEEQLLVQALKKAQHHPLLVMLYGAAGSGKSHLAKWLTQRPEVFALTVPSCTSSRLVLASLATHLLPHLDEEGQQVVQQVRIHPQDLETDLMRLTSVLERLALLPLMVFEDSPAASTQLLALFDFWMTNLPRGLFVVLSREQSPPNVLTRGLLRRVPADHRWDISISPLSLQSIEQALLERDPEQPAELSLSYANQLLQRSDGNVQHLLTLIEEDRASLHDTMSSRAVHEIYLSEAEHWSPQLYQAMRYLSTIHLPFDEQLVNELLERMALPHAIALLSEGLDKGVVVPHQGARARIFPYWTPLQNRSELSERFEFSREPMRIALASSLPHPLRQALRRHLSELLELSAPGLAGYYALRTGQSERAARLLERHRSRLPQDSPLHDLAAPPVGIPSDAPIPAPAHTPASLTSMREEGYQVALERGWLSIRRRGRYGPPGTLHLLFPVQAGVETSSLRLVWRLDTFNAGHDLFPTEVPFALRLRVGNQSVVFSPEPLRDFVEDSQRQQGVGGVQMGRWLEHHISLDPYPAGALLEVGVRTLDVALLIGSMHLNGTDLFDSVRLRGNTHTLLAAHSSLS